MGDAVDSAMGFMSIMLGLVIAGPTLARIASKG